MIQVHQFLGLKPGPRLIVLGAVHGNETCGTIAMRRLIEELGTGILRIGCGSLTLVPVANPLAFARGQRAADRNLNRNFRPTLHPQDNEDRIANVLCPLLASHDVLLDLHSFQSAGEPFAMRGPGNNCGTLEPFSLANEEHALAVRLGVRRIVDGWVTTYSTGVAERLARTPPANRAGLLSVDPCYGMGTTEYLRSQGGFSITLECGQHEDASAPEVAYQAVRNALAHLGLIEDTAPPVCPDPEYLLLTQVVDRLHADDTFSRPWTSFTPVARGDVIGVRHGGGAVAAGQDGFVVFPNPHATVGNEWFYLAQLSQQT
jgi:predicted deacylase